MRPLISSFLVAILAICPMLCRTESGGCCAEVEEKMCVNPENLPAPLPVENGSEDCICAGAVRDFDSRVVSNLDHVEKAVDPFGLPVSHLIPALSIHTHSGFAVAGEIPTAPLRTHLLLATLRC